ETSTIGLRFHPVARLKLAREVREIETRWGKIRVKFSGVHHGAPITISPEYDDCRKAALENRVALRTVIDDAREAARRSLG
ncbi:MAG TPA: nickel insertion protein, partial [Candidatus Binataceae bacterium]